MIDFLTSCGTGWQASSLVQPVNHGLQTRATLSSFDAVSAFGLFDFSTFGLAVAIYGVAFALVSAGEFYRCHTADVSCSCGRARRRLTIVDPVDADRLQQLLTEECPACRDRGREFAAPQAAAGEKP